MDDKFKGTRLDPEVSRSALGPGEILTPQEIMEQAQPAPAYTIPIRTTTNSQVILTGISEAHVREQMVALQRDGWFPAGNVGREGSRYGITMEKEAPAEAAGLSSIQHACADNMAADNTAGDQAFLKTVDALLDRTAEQTTAIESLRLEVFVRAEDPVKLQAALSEVSRRVGPDFTSGCGSAQGSGMRKGVGFEFTLVKETDADIVRDQAIRAAAHEALNRDEKCEIDLDAKLAHGVDNGCYVQNWTWFSFAGTPWDKEKGDAP